MKNPFLSLSSNENLVTNSIIYMDKVISNPEKSLDDDAIFRKAQIYFENSVGIGEHPDIVAAIESETEKLAAAQEKIDVLQKHFILPE